MAEGKAKKRGLGTDKTPKAKRGAAKVFDPMTVAKPLPVLDDEKIAIVRNLFLSGANDKHVAAFLDVDLLTLEDMIQAHPSLRPKKDHGTTGRPTKFNAKFIEQGRKLAQLGATDLEIAQFFEVSLRTVHRWKIEHDEFRDAIEIGKDVADAKVEQSLYRRATGYSFDSEKIVVVEGEPVRLETIEHVPPDTKAALAWLYNRRPEQWRSTQHLKHDVAPESPLASFLRDISGSMPRPVPDDDEPLTGAGGGGTFLPQDDPEEG